MKEVDGIRTPVLPVGIFLVGTLSLVLYKDKNLSSAIRPELLRASELLHLSPDCIYSFLTLFLLPLLFLFLMRQNPRDYGLSLGRVRLALPLLVLISAVLTVCCRLIAEMEAMKTYYAANLRHLGDYVYLFVTYLFIMWSWEFINRGFLLIGLKRYVGVYSVYIQLIPFVILHVGKPTFELYGSIPFGLLLGFYAYVTNSFLYCVIVHAYFATMMKVFISLS
jgi:hypothetical protein